MSVTIKDVANQAMVSTATVSHVINKTRYVADDTARRVWDAIESLGYNLNNVARSLRSQKTNTIGLLIPDISNYFFADIVGAVQKVLKENHYHLILGNSNENPEDEIEQLEVFRRQCIDGLILATTAEDCSYLSDLVSRHFPVVFIDRRPRGFEADCVLVNNLNGTRSAVTSLIDKGHRRIGFIGGLSRLTTSAERLEGYKRALTEHGLEIDEAIILSGDSRVDSGFELTKKLAGSMGVTAIVVGNNLMTVGAMDYLNRSGYRVPADMAVIGFDDYRWAEITNPPLSVIKQPAADIGRTAAELLLRRIERGDGDYKEICLPVELIRRQSF